MKSFNHVIQDALGIHARPAGELAKLAKTFESTVSITKGDKTVTASQLLKLMGLGVKVGEEVTISAEGADEDTAIVALEAFFKEKL